MQIQTWAEELWRHTSGVSQSSSPYQISEKQKEPFSPYVLSWIFSVNKSWDGMDPHLRLALLALLCAICALWLKDSQGDLGRSITELWLCVGTCHPFAVLDLTHTNHNAAVKKLIRFEWFFKSQWRSRNQKPLKHNLTFISPSLLLMSDTGVWVDAVMSYCKFLLFCYLKCIILYQKKHWNEPFKLSLKQS